MKYFLIVINSLSIVFILIIKVILSNNLLKLDDYFLGVRFIDFRIRFVDNIRLFFLLFIATGVIAIFLKMQTGWKLLIVALSILGYFLYHSSYGQVAPW